MMGILLNSISFGRFVYEFGVVFYEVFLLGVF